MGRGGQHNEGTPAYTGSDHPKARRRKKLLAQGQDMAEVARHLEVNPGTWYRWRNQYGGMKANDAKRL
jgi:transposase-like protein